MANNDTRLIEVAFPLKQASIDSVHEKNVRHGHISTIHVWPARRPLAASRAALIATLLRDPEKQEDRDDLLTKLGGRLAAVSKKKKLPNGKMEEIKGEETLGGILHWGTESNPDIEWFRNQIRQAYNGSPPKVLDPFAGGGAIPLEAMRMGCDVTAIDINPVAWFILKATLEYPSRLSGAHLPLPSFALSSPDFMQQFFRGTAKLTKKQLERNLQAVQDSLFPPPAVGLAWHIRAWGWWVLQKANLELAQYYPAIDGKPTVAYLWARTAKCKNCRARIPLIKTKWLCKKPSKRVLLVCTPTADGSDLEFTVQIDVPEVGGNAAQRREHDKKIGAGTMRGKGPTLVVHCPVCGQPSLTAEDLRRISCDSGLDNVLIAVVVDSAGGKEYRAVTQAEREAYAQACLNIDKIGESIPFGFPEEQTPGPAGRKSNSSSLRIYGFNTWKQLFNLRQLRAAATFTKLVRAAATELDSFGYSPEWKEALFTYLCLAVDRFLDYSSSFCMWHNSGEYLAHTFTRFALPMIWDYCEVNGLSNTTGNFLGGIEWIALVVEHTTKALASAPTPTVINGSSISTTLDPGTFDLVLTDPPYYDAIAYADVMDFFYVWLRRMSHGTGFPHADITQLPTTPKWDIDSSDGELIDNPWRFKGDKDASSRAYEDGMTAVFRQAHAALKADGRLVVVFASKDPKAWEALAGAVIRAGFVVDASWPIQTEMGGGVRNFGRASLASSVWLVCKKRSDLARPGWDNTVLAEMHDRIQMGLRAFWDAGIRGPDFVWAATGPALEIYSRHPVVKKANAPGEFMKVSEFLGHVRRIVVDFIVGQVLSHDGAADTVSGLDDLTTYYILHRYDFGFEEAPIGACILYATSCGLSDRELTDRYELLVRTGGSAEVEEADEDEDADDGEKDSTSSSGGKVKLRPWTQRHRKNLGGDVDGKPAPLIDQIHCLMHLWKLGDVMKVDEYLDSRALRRNDVFVQLIQALIELSSTGSDERAILESLSNHVAARGAGFEDKQMLLEN